MRTNRRTSWFSDALLASTPIRANPLNPAMALRGLELGSHGCDPRAHFCAMPKSPMALVHDEYGHFEGIMTPADALETIVGAFLLTVLSRVPFGVRMDRGYLQAGCRLTSWRT